MGLVSGYDIEFSLSCSRNQRKAVPAKVSRGNAALRNAKENSLQVRGTRLFNLLPSILKNAKHGDILMSKNIGICCTKKGANEMNYLM